jgi:hypothetical protein
MTTELDLARNEIKELNKQYLKEKLSITEVELEKLSERKLNAS